MPTKEQLEEICDIYEIGNLVDLVEVFPGTANPNIKILTSTDTYVIKIFYAKQARLRFVLKILRQLEMYKIPALMPIKNSKGVYFEKYGEKVYQVTKLVKGYNFDGDLNQVKASGKMLRLFHDTLSGIGEDVEPAGSLYPSAGVLDMALANLQSLTNQIPKDQYDQILKLYNGIICSWNKKATKLPSTIIHGDWHMGNQLFTRSGEVKCIMDFDFMKRAERLFDLAYAVWYIDYHFPNTSLAEDFLHGYGTLLDDEIMLLPLEIARLNTFFIITSLLSRHPLIELNRQYSKMLPNIEWVMTPQGERRIRNMCKRKLYL